MYKLIIFDFYGVINKTDPYGVWLKSQGLKREGQFQDVAKAVDTGHINLQEFLDRLSELTDQSSTSIRTFFNQSVEINTDVTDLINRLKDKHKIVLVSNAPYELLRPTLAQHNLEQYFDEIFISSELGIRKPNPKLFKSVIEKMNTLPTEALFIDDLQEYIKGAESIGITGIQFINARQLTRELNSRL